MTYKYTLYDIDGYLDDDGGFETEEDAEDAALKRCLNIEKRCEEQCESSLGLEYCVSEEE